jgi:hypothetical protein
MADNNFKLWCYSEVGSEPFLMRVGITEPAEAIDVAEDWLQEWGIKGSSYCELKFNGTEEVHTSVFMLAEGKLGIWNAEVAPWPVYYPHESPYGEMLAGIPEEFLPPEEAEIEEDLATGEEDEDGLGDETDEDSDTMDLSNDGEDENDETPESEEDDAEEDEAEEDEANSDSEDDEEDGAEEGEEGDDEDELDQDDDDESEDESDEEETEMPRLNIFAKMRGPKGWRKRANAEELLDRNVFALKVGVLDPEQPTAGKQERELVAHIEFVESDDNRAAGLLRIKLPTGTNLEDFTQAKNGWITAEVPYKREED